MTNKFHFSARDSICFIFYDPYEGTESIACTLVILGEMWKESFAPRDHLMCWMRVGKLLLSHWLYKYSFRLNSNHALFLIPIKFATKLFMKICLLWNKKHISWITRVSNYPFTALRTQVTLHAFRFILL